ncbi:MAG: DJ-1 family glyoxalase III [Candidatus Omnitrophota bacterium]
MKKKIAVLLADGFEEIEAVNVIDVLRRAGLDVAIVGVGASVIKGSRGINIKPDIDIASYNDLPDAIVLPGGMGGVQNLAATPKVSSLIKELNQKGKVIAAICAAPPYVLLPLGILEGKKATCYPGCGEKFGKNIIRGEGNVVIDGNIITSKGPGTAMEFALALVEVLCGKNVKDTVSKNLLYEPR